MTTIEDKRKELEEEIIKEREAETNNSWIPAMQLELFNEGVEMARKEFIEIVNKEFEKLESNINKIFDEEDKTK